MDYMRNVGRSSDFLLPFPAFPVASPDAASGIFPFSRKGWAKLNGGYSSGTVQDFHLIPY